MSTFKNGSRVIRHRLRRSRVQVCAITDGGYKTRRWTDANSTDNRDNIGNPLFRLSITTRGSATDCQNSADCGPC